MTFSQKTNSSIYSMKSWIFQNFPNFSSLKLLSTLPLAFGYAKKFSAGPLVLGYAIFSFYFEFSLIHGAKRKA